MGSWKNLVGAFLVVGAAACGLPSAPGTEAAVDELSSGNTCQGVALEVVDAWEQVVGEVPGRCYSELAQYRILVIPDISLTPCAPPAEDLAERAELSLSGCVDPNVYMLYVVEDARRGEEVRTATWLWVYALGWCAQRDGFDTRANDPVLWRGQSSVFGVASRLAAGAGERCE